jgi:uncharacterized small protein (DUF1192 family)
MRNTHEPTDEFIERLESRVAGEVRARNRMPAPRWIPQTRWQFGLAVTVLVVVSMGLGAGGTAVAFQAKNAQVREALISSYTARKAAADARLKASERTLDTVERRFELGAASLSDVVQAQNTLTQAQENAARTALLLAEVQSTGREPLDEITAPLASGRDFVTERLRLSLPLAQMELDVQRRESREAEKRKALGTVLASDAMTRAKVAEAEAAVAALRSKIEIRQRFLSGTLNGQTAELRLLESEAEQRIATLAPKVEAAQAEMERYQEEVKLGTRAPLDIARARFQLLELQQQSAKASLDLEIARSQLAAGRGKR